jgi:hypothetical protein
MTVIPEKKRHRRDACATGLFATYPKYFSSQIKKAGKSPPFIFKRIGVWRSGIFD